MNNIPNLNTTTTIASSNSMHEYTIRNWENTGLNWQNVYSKQSHHHAWSARARNNQIYPINPNSTKIKFLPEQNPFDWYWSGKCKNGCFHLHKQSSNRLLTNRNLQYVLYTYSIKFRTTQLHLNRTQIHDILSRNIEKTKGSVFTRTSKSIVHRVPVSHPYRTSITIASTNNLHFLQVHLEDLTLETCSKETIAE